MRCRRVATALPSSRPFSRPVHPHFVRNRTPSVSLDWAVAHGVPLISWSIFALLSYLRPVLSTSDRAAPGPFYRAQGACAEHDSDSQPSRPAVPSLSGLFALVPCLRRYAHHSTLLPAFPSCFRQAGSPISNAAIFSTFADCASRLRFCVHLRHLQLLCTMLML